MENIIEFVTEQGVALAGVIALVIVLAERIALITPNTTDNKIVGVVRKIAEVVGLKFEDKQ
jgi:hypothetical protein